MGIPYNHFYKDLTLSQVREWEGTSHTPTCIPLRTFTKKRPNSSQRTVDSTLHLLPRYRTSRLHGV
jgi:hypothetical protein